MRPSWVYRDWLRGVLAFWIHPEDVGLLPGEPIEDLTMDDLEAANVLASELIFGDQLGIAQPPPDYRRRSWRERAEAAYRDDSCPERACDRCGEPYKGPAVYCSLACAVADA